MEKIVITSPVSERTELALVQLLPVAVCSLEAGCAGGVVGRADDGHVGAGGGGGSAALLARPRPRHGVGDGEDGPGEESGSGQAAQIKF